MSDLVFLEVGLKAAAAIVEKQDCPTVAEAIHEAIGEIKRLEAENQRLKDESEGAEKRGFVAAYCAAGWDELTFYTDEEKRKAAEEDFAEWKQKKEKAPTE